MNDLVERLNKEADCIGTGAGQFIMREAAAEIARLRARPTEDEVAQAIARADYAEDTVPADWQMYLPHARAAIAPFPKVQP